MRRALFLFPLAVLAAGLASGCSSTLRKAPVDVTRYHLGGALTPGTVTIEPVSTNATISPEYRIFADAVGVELSDLGLTPVADPVDTGYVAVVSFARTSRGTVRERPPVTIGLGGVTGGSSVGVGGGVSLGLGGREREVYATELAVQLRRRGDGTTIWEGRAITETVSGSEAGQPAVLAPRLAKALFRGFPGESGITITVP